MATSRSPDAGWTAGAHVFSGRPDPRWPLAAVEAARLVAIWHALEPLRGAPPAPPPLGYRGCFADDGEGRRWKAFAGVVTCARERRSDPPRDFERLVVESAPPAALPPRIKELAGL